MSDRCNQKVTVGIGEAVEQHYYMGVTVQEQVFFTVLTLAGRFE